MTLLRDNPITLTVDLEQEGVQHGFMKLPHSHDASAWGSLMIPITVAKNSTGPTVLLTGGNHGDEYEGPLALFDLANQISGLDINGRVIIVPAMNLPAFRAAKRTSPLDGGNLNRLFPGKPDGTVTEKIADYFQRTLLPMADYVLDFHSGGQTLDFVPFCAAHVLENKSQQDQCVAAMRAFNAPYSIMLLEVDAVGMFDTAAEEMGKVFISTELGGGGAPQPQHVAVAKRGIVNLLKHVHVLEGEPDKTPTINLDMPDGRCYVSSESDGLFEPCVELGMRVKKGQTVARVFDPTRTGTRPVVYESPLDGIFIARHFPGLVKMGDIICVVAVEV
ncbi:N-alpha-acetyl diaminobutyric acid deacetylase DoeB [Roseibium hamelinense]|nr:N(2)-acetyl-L-2,4-diaminobutanoate deacetylase DoeB [Roseibium hamelinense]MTI45098.1 N-alpha-acetyl diaminobutyric acid deacetylase DoeB [Roseibium hamelinense]